MGSVMRDVIRALPAAIVLEYMHVLTSTRTVVTRVPEPLRDFGDLTVGVIAVRIVD